MKPTKMLQKVIVNDALFIALRQFRTFSTGRSIVGGGHQRPTERNWTYGACPAVAHCPKAGLPRRSPQREGGSLGGAA